MGTGSWLAAREDPRIYIPFLIAAIIIGIFIIVSIVIMVVKAKLNLPPKIERLKKKKTNMRNIARVTDGYQLTGAEAAILTRICKKHRVPNIEYFFDDVEKTNALFKTVFDELAAESKPDAEQARFFSLFTKINKHRFSLVKHTTVRSILNEQELFYVDASGKKNKSMLIENNDREMILSVPKDERGNEVRPPELSKINLFFTGKNDTAFTIAVRVIRYQDHLSVPQMVVTHSLDIKAYMREEYLYIPMNIPCTFSAARSLPGAKNTVVYENEGEAHSGMLINFSGETCNIAAQDTAEIQQNIKIEVNLDGKNTSTIIAVVANTAHNDTNGLHVLHAKYVEMDDRTRNYILARVYDFI